MADELKAFMAQVMEQFSLIQQKIGEMDKRIDAVHEDVKKLSSEIQPIRLDVRFLKETVSRMENQQKYFLAKLAEHDVDIYTLKNS